MPRTAAAVGQAPVERQVAGWPGWSTLHADGAIQSCCCHVDSAEEAAVRWGVNRGAAARSDRGVQLIRSYLCPLVGLLWGAVRAQSVPRPVYQSYIAAQSCDADNRRLAPWDQSKCSVPGSLLYLPEFTARHHVCIVLSGLSGQVGP